MPCLTYVSQIITMLLLAAKNVYFASLHEFTINLNLIVLDNIFYMDGNSSTINAYMKSYATELKK